MVAKDRQLKQPLFYRILSYLGFLDIPQKVNCWYCNNDSFLLPGNRDTIYNWYCHMCENRNIKDINGDIIDPSLLDTNHTADSGPKYCKPMKLRETPRSICVDCQRNQSLVYQFLSEYIPDENDPNYQYRYETADDYKHTLEDKYHVCSECNVKIDQVLHEQSDILNLRRFNEIMAKSLTAPPPKKPTRTNYVCSGLLWLFVHTSILLFMFYVSMYAPQRSSWYDMDYSWLYSSRELFTYGIGLSILKEKVSLVITDQSERIKNTVLCLCTLSDQCDWDIIYSFPLLMAVTVISWKSIDWHPTAYRTFQEKGRIGHWRCYQITQRFLYLYRLILILGTTFTQYFDKNMYICMLLYIIPHLSSILYVKVPKRLKKVGSRLEGFSRSTSAISESSKKPLEDDMMSTTEMSIVTENKDDLDAITSGFCKIRV